MKRIASLLKVYITQYVLLLCLFILLRLGFIAFNASYFGGFSEMSLSSLILKGFRFDVSAISVLMIPFGLLLLFIPNTKEQKTFYKWFLWIPVIFAMLFEMADWLYFPFNHKRSTAEVLSLLGANSDFVELLPSFFKEFYYIFLIAALVIIIYTLVSNKLFDLTAYSKVHNSSKFLTFLYNFIFLVLFSGLSLVGIRGGFQLVPINVRNAVEVVDAKFAPIVLNTPFSIIHTVANKHLELLDWMSEEEMNQLAPTLHDAFGSSNQFQKENVMIIVLESFSKDFTQLGAHEESHTPFLDSLMDHAEVYTNAYATGLHSAEGIPAILASMPSWMSENFTASMYGSNKIQGIASLLSIEGYNSAFFHGAHNGSMGFDVFSKNAGFKYYYGKNEYPGKGNYDGAWGIFDKPFFKYSLSMINQMEEPFVNCLFSISSHSPYALPEGDRERLETKDFPIYGTIRYTDEALRDFFIEAKGQDWFDRTWFVLTADHTSPINKNQEALQDFKKYEIPIVIYHPKKTKEAKRIHETVNQLDIMPILLKKMQYPKPFFAFGQYDLSKGVGMMAELNNQFYVKNRSDCEMILNEFTEHVDNAVKVDVCDTEEKESLWKVYQAFRQKYNEVLIHNAVPSIK